MNGSLSGKNNGRYSHGMAGTRPYSVWSSMLTRCRNKKSTAYKNYGGRGIKVCDKWVKFEGFWEDMENGYSEKLTLDRVDNNECYSKENCRWIPRSEQPLNRRSNVFLEFNGKRQIVTVWARELGLNTSTVQSRVQRGWTVEKILAPLTRKSPSNTIFNPRNKK